MRDDRVVARLAGKFDGLDSFGDAADLVQLDENGVGDAFLDAAGQALGARDEEVVADKRSEEHTSELQSQSNLVCRLLLEKNNWRRLRTRRPKLGSTLPVGSVRIKCTAWK